MIKMQDKILNAIDENAKNYELEAVVSYAASNTGNLHIMDGFDNVLIISFNFQSDYCSLKVFDKNGKERPHLSRGYLEYQNSALLKGILNIYDDYMREYDMEKQEEINEPTREMR